jgi:hypothetical protein
MPTVGRGKHFLEKIDLIHILIGIRVVVNFCFDFGKSRLQIVWWVWVIRRRISEIGEVCKSWSITATLYKLWEYIKFYLFAILRISPFHLSYETFGASR